MKLKVGAFLGGALFGIGLALSGMTQPSKIVGFFDFGPAWDPSLAFVMLGALLVYAPLYRWVVRKLDRPLWAPQFSLPTRTDLDWRLLTGASLFGVGWGLGGYCPGPALTSIGAGSRQALLFGAAMVVSMALYRWVTRPRATRTEPNAVVDG
ncbi:MAG: DUF6691 family protein [Myxococcota bacterium]